MWRPENWGKYIAKTLKEYPDVDGYYPNQTLIEAGADAMLEALYEINKGNWIQLKRDKEGNFYILAEGGN